MLLLADGVYIVVLSYDLPSSLASFESGVRLSKSFVVCALSEVGICIWDPTVSSPYLSSRSSCVDIERPNLGLTIAFVYRLGIPSFFSSIISTKAGYSFIISMPKMLN
jgi:hypothetical protein